MLKDSLYTVKKNSKENNAVEAIAELNTQHEIFKGHFPSQPVLPGVCMLQMIKEILETTLNIKLQLIKANEIKFLSMIQPTGEDLQFSIQYDFKEDTTLNINAKIVKNEVICCKVKALYQTK